MRLGPSEGVFSFRARRYTDVEDETLGGPGVAPNLCGSIAIGQDIGIDGVLDCLFEGPTDRSFRGS